MVAFHIGPLTIAWYGIMITTGVIAAILVASIEAKRRQDNPEHIMNIAIFALPLGMIGARLYHVIDQWSYYSQHPSLIIGGAGLGIFGAVIGGVTGLFIYTRWQKLSTLHWLDIVAPGLILAQAIGRWGNFFNQELYGNPTNLPWGWFIDEAHRLPGFENYTHFHPLFAYEFLWNVTGCVLLLWIARKWQKSLLNGDIFLMYIIYYSIGRFYLEGIKLDVWAIGGIPTARWITAIAFGISTVILIYRHRRKTPVPSA